MKINLSRAHGSGDHHREAALAFKYISRGCTCMIEPSILPKLVVHAMSGLLVPDQLLGSRPTHTCCGKTERKIAVDLRLVRCYPLLVASPVWSLPQSGESEGRLWQIAERDSRSCKGVSKGEVTVSQSESIISPRLLLVSGHSGLHVMLGKATSS
jgi:hypothetical protein